MARTRSSACGTWARLAVVLMAAGWSAIAAIAGEDGPQVALQEDFEKGLDGWHQEGPAEYTVSGEQPHQGGKAARITVADKPAYQKLARFVGEKANAGDAFHATVWVRTAGVAANPGAYIVFVFFDGGNRIEVSHGGMDRKFYVNDFHRGDPFA